MSFAIATTLDEALAAVASGAQPIAGGTDLVVGSRQGKTPLPEALIAIDRIDELREVSVTARGLRIGAAVSFDNLLSNAAVRRQFTALADAAALVGSPATRNVGTIGGNVMNASPAMDSGAPLLALGATVELASVQGKRAIPVADLWAGPGSTTAHEGELCTAIEVPEPAPASGSAYVRLEYRRAMEIAVVGAGAVVSLDAGEITSAKVALAAVAPTIVSLSVDDILVGRPMDADTRSSLAEEAADRAEPISDLRASDRYRRHCVGVMAVRAVEAAVARAGGADLAIPVNRSLGVGER